MPDTWLNIEAKSLFYQNRVPISYSAQNITMEEAGKSVANQLGLDFEWQAETQKTIDVFNFRGSKAQLIEKYNSFGDVIAFEDNGVLKVQDRNSQRKKSGQIKLISKDTGMIGIPEPDQFGVKVKCLLDPSLACGDWVQVKSERLKSINGQYQIYTLDFDLSSREQAYYCDIYAKNYGIY